MGSGDVDQFGPPSRLSLQVRDALMLRVHIRGAPLPVVAVDELDHGAELREGHAGGGASVNAVDRKHGLCSGLQLGVLLELLSYLAVRRRLFRLTGDPHRWEYVGAVNAHLARVVPHGGGRNGPRGGEFPDALLLSARSRHVLGYRHLPGEHVVQAGLLEPLAVRGVQGLQALELLGLGVAATRCARRACLFA